MAIGYRVDILAALKKKGISTYYIRKKKLLNEAALQRIRCGRSVSWDNLGTLCRLLECQPGDILIYTQDGDQDAHKGDPCPQPPGTAQKGDPCP